MVPSKRLPASYPTSRGPAEATRRGLGSALLRKPQKLARLVAGIVEGSELPVTVKIRTGEKEEKINAAEVAALMEAAGAAAVTIHGAPLPVGFCMGWVRGLAWGVSLRRRAPWGWHSRGPKPCRAAALHQMKPQPPWPRQQHEPHPPPPPTQAPPHP